VSRVTQAQRWLNILDVRALTPVFLNVWRQRGGKAGRENAEFYVPGKQCTAVVPTDSINWNLIKHGAMFCSVPVAQSAHNSMIIVQIAQLRYVSAITR
jgi:hypothetical protein